MEITPATKSCANAKYESSALYPIITSYDEISGRKFSFI